MKKIGIPAQRRSSFSGTNLVLRFVYITVLVLSFSFFALYARITGWIFSANKIDIFNDLDQIAFYFWLIDPEISRQLLTFDEIIQDYLAGANVLQTKEKELTELWNYAREQGPYLTKLGF